MFDRLFKSLIANASTRIILLVLYESYDYLHAGLIHGFKKLYYRLYIFLPIYALPLIFFCSICFILDQHTRSSIS